MDKSKLIQIIEKELEELKVLTQEVAESERDTSLIIEIALSKARLLCQEMELLRELSTQDGPFPATDLQEENDLNDEDEVSDENISDPELEIIDPDEEYLDEIPEEELEEEDEEEEFVKEEEYTEEEDETLEEPETKEDLIEFGENTEEDIAEEEDEEPASPDEPTTAKSERPAMIREIEFDDDEDIEPVKSAPVTATSERPVMREIPKPEEPLLKNEEEEPAQKGQSLNDTMGERKSPESTITSGPITSLKAAIGLNDRFLFIREIFANNTDKYNTIIDHLDKLETIQQAVDYLKANLTLQKNETSMKFVDLLKRRFTK